jgi:hypothetical protein
MKGSPGVLAAGLALLTVLVWIMAPIGPAPMAQHGSEHGKPGRPGASRQPAGSGVRISMEELHRAGGVPPGWRFSWPAGDAAKGRDIFARLEC